MDKSKQEILKDIQESGCAILKKKNGRIQIWTPFEYKDDQGRNCTRMVPDCFATLQDVYKFLKMEGLIEKKMGVV